MTHITEQRAATPRAIATALARLREVEPQIHAFVEVFEVEAVAEERKAARSGVAGPLAGVPVAVKDLFDVAGHATLSGSRAADAIPARRDSTAVRRLREAGAVILGKTVTHEYAFGAMSPPTRNPWNLNRVPAGSSGGSGAAVAAGIVPVAMGTDTGGSIRMPAAVCGVVGFKPSYGLLSRSGVTPLSGTLDHVGPLTSRVRDAAAVVDALAGFDPEDPGSREFAPPKTLELLDRGVQGLTLGMPENYFYEIADYDIAEACQQAARELESAGARLVPINFPNPQLCGETVLVIAAAEAARIHRSRFMARRGDFTPDVAEAIEMGLGLRAVDLVEAYEFCRALQKEAVRLFSAVDAVLTPTVGTEPPEFGATSMRLAGRQVSTLAGLNALTVQADVLGIPALAVPAGFNRNGLPLSLQVMTASGQDALALAIGQTYEERTDWHKMEPSLTAA